MWKRSTPPARDPAAWLFAHLYNPRNNPELWNSTCPPHPFLFEKREIKGSPLRDALPIDAGEDLELVPDSDAKALVSYLLSLKKDHPVPASLEFRSGEKRRRQLNFPPSHPISTMSSPNQKPDLEDSINVTEAHGRVVREAAACAREKRIANNGSEPISLWVIAACGVVCHHRRRHPRRRRQTCSPTVRLSARAMSGPRLRAPRNRARNPRRRSPPT